MLRWFRAFLPKEERFFDLFARHSQTVVQGALALQGMLRGGEETPVFCQRVNQFENDADNITREVLTAVRRTFITPFDRGDIKDLITSMDDAIDQMQQTAKTIMLFEQRSFTPQQREMADAIVRVFQAMFDARFPIRRMRPVDAYGGNDERSLAADNTAAFNCRYAVGPGPRRWPVHAYGLAIDVNPVENPYLESGRVHPRAGRAYLDRSNVRPGMAVRGGLLDPRMLWT